MAAILHEYELSIWKDVWAQPTLLDAEGNVTEILNGNEVLDEEKSAILSTDNFTFPGKANNIVLKEKINGTHELTFDLPAKYIDPSTGKKVKNYLRELTDNETKIKLNFKNKWYTFYVKKVVEKREKNYSYFNYTCEDSFITELSKIGYKLTFNEYTKHYIEQIHTFAEDILEDSEWTYNQSATDANCDLIEYQEEKLVAYRVNSGTMAHRLVGSKFHHLYATDSNYINIPSGTIVFGFYSEAGANNNIIDTYGYGLTSAFQGKVTAEHSNASSRYIKQIIYVPEINAGENPYEYSGNTICNKNCNYIVPASALSPIELSPNDPNYLRYGLRIAYNPYTVYNKALKRFVKVYGENGNSTPVLYSFTKTRVMVPEIATNYAANGKDMVDTTGWAPEMAVDKLSVDKIESGSWSMQDGVPYLNLVNGVKQPNIYGIVASQLTSSTKGGSIVKIINTGPYSRKLKIETPTTFAVKLKYRWTKPKETTIVSNDVNSELLLSSNRERANGPTPTLKICQPLVAGIGDSYYKEIITESSAKDDDGNYEFSANALAAINITNSNDYYLIKFTNSMLSKGPLTDLFIVIEIDGETNQELDFCIEELEFFEAWTHEGKHTRGATGTVIPDSMIVPAWRDWDNGHQYNWMKEYINGLNNGNTGSASQVYSNMMSALSTWTNGKEGANTLVTSNSIVSGKTFDEEVYFYEPASQPLFGEPYVNFVNPEDVDDVTTVRAIEQLYNNYKYRTLKQEKSNRFNLTQKLSELFHVYPVYEIEYYPNGKVKRRLYSEDGAEINSSGTFVSYFKRNKFLYYSDQKGGENKYGFKYGHNLNSISRTVDSTNVVTKMFVTDNVTQYATDGICTISRASDNLGKDNYLLRFDYFINRNKVSRERIDRDLYGTNAIKTYEWSDFENSNALDEYRSEIKNFSGYSFDSVVVYEGFLYTIGKINTRYDKLSADQALLEKHQLVVLEASVQTFSSALKALKEQLAKQKNLTAAYQKESVNKKQAEYAESCLRIESKIDNYEIMLNAAQSMYETYADLYNRYDCEMKFLLWSKKKIEKIFNTRYEALIKEGVWQDSKYLDDNAYFLDAEKVLVDSCGPKINYTLSVTDLSMLPKYQFTDFQIGDVTYVEDYEFFEDDLESNDKFYTERTIVSAISYNLDNPSKNTISLQNYSTKFDDLFSRITASVQSLTFNENIYQRAANFTPDGRINPDTIQGTLDDNNLTLVGNQDVRIDGNGILVTDLRIPSNKVKIVGSGVFLTADGGASWYGAFENGGINASLLTVGAINTKSISIFNENYSNFIWDKEGLTAYGTVSAMNSKKSTDKAKTGIVAHTYVRFNQYGLFFVNEDIDFDTKLIALQEKAKGKLSSKVTAHIMENASVAITYDGFSINGADKKVRFTSADGIVMYDESGDKKVQLGYITENLPSSIKPFWGLYAEGAYIEGRLYSDKVINRSVQMGTSSTNKTKVNDHSRSMLYGGKLQICRTIVSREDGEEVFTDEIKPITTFGSSLIKVGAAGSESEAGSENATNQYLANLGSSIYVEKEGKFWSLAIPSSKNEKDYTSRLFYAKDDVGNYNADTFYVKCNFNSESGTSTSSDRRIKKNIEPLNDKYLQMFDLLKPQTYNLITEEDSTPRHIGLIAQDVIEARNKVGLKEHDLNAVRYVFQDTLSISYSEILTIAIAKIQQLEKRIAELENK